MAVEIRKVDGYRVTHGGKVSAKGTTKRKAESQRNLLNATRRGWKPTGKSARYKKRKAQERARELRRQLT